MSKSAAETLSALCESYWQELLAHHPTYASALGYRQHDARLPDLSPERRAAHFSTLKDLKRQADALDFDSLSHDDGVTLEVLRTTLTIECDAEAHVAERWSVNPLFGTHVWLADLAQRQPTSNADELANLIDRYEAVPTLLDQEMGHLKDGITRGQTAYYIAIERSIAQLDRLLSIPVEGSTFIPAKDRGDALADGRRELIEPLINVVKNTVYPALTAYRDFLSGAYLSRARRAPGMNAIPGGEAYYNHTILEYTGVKRTPEEIHQKGLEELARLHEEMKVVMAREGGSGNFIEFAKELQSRPELFPKSREEILEANQAIVERATKALPDYFEALPQRPCEVRLVESYREADSPAGYYDRAPDDGSRPAYYYVNGHNPQERPLYNMEALAFHEAVPGHHLQIAIAQELTNLPIFRRHLGNIAFIEGWALYTERLADEMGLYSSELARFGMLIFQAWRATRLVLDTGLHAMGWSRQKAIDFMIDATGHSITEATIEVDRYISMPGQALAYMLGRMSLDAMRSRAQAAFGNRFDVKAFHSKILNDGALPLATLDRLIDRWIAEAA